MVDVRLSSLDAETLSEQALNDIADACREALVKILSAWVTGHWQKLSFGNLETWIKHWR